MAARRPYEFRRFWIGTAVDLLGRLQRLGQEITSVDAKYSFMFTIEWEMPYFDMGSTFNYNEMVALLAPRPFHGRTRSRRRSGPDEWVAYEYAKVRRLYDH